MPEIDITTLQPPAETHQHATWLLRRPFAPGAIGFRATTKVALNGNPHGGAQIAAYITAQSVLQRLNSVAPGRWRMQFAPLTPELLTVGQRKLYLACRLTITLPAEAGGPDRDAVYEDVGELDHGSLAGLKTLFCDARNRAGVAAGIGAYLYTALEPVVLAIGDGPRQVQLVRRQGKPDLLTISAATEQWLRAGYATRIATDAVRRDLGEILPHGEPDNGTGQGEAADQRPQSPTSEQPPTLVAVPEPTVQSGNGAGEPTVHTGNGVVSVDFGRLGPAA